MKNYELHYNPDNHSYKRRLPFHLFFIVWGTIDNRYEDGSMGFNEGIFLKLKLKSGKWVAYDVSIKP